MPARPLRRLLLGVAIVVVTGWLLIHQCASGGGMGAAYSTCECFGFEWERYDRRPADGPHSTVCVGIVQSRTCHRHESGPVIPCPP